MAEGAPPISPKKQPLELNTQRLNELVSLMSTPIDGRAARFEEIQLTEADKEEMLRIADAIDEHVLEGVQNDTNWLEFQRLYRNLDARGLTHSGSFPPSWLKNGGPNAKVQEVKEPDRIKIVVPDTIFNAYYWKEKAEQLRGSIRGQGSQSVTHLARELKEAAYFLKQTGKI